MKFLSVSGSFPGMRAACSLLASLACSTALAATDVPLWHSLTGHNAGVLQDLVKAYNRSQSEVRVQLRAFNTPEELDLALGAADSGSLPALAQLGDTHMLDQIAQRPYVQPFHEVQKSGPFKQVSWFLAADNAFVYDNRGRLMAFPYMLQVPVMYYNLAAFDKAGLVPAAPQRTWIDLQGQLVSMANRGSRTCPLTSDLPVSINLENLAAVNNQLYASADNGLKAKGLPSFSFDSTYVRHLALMISWVRSELMVRPDVGMHSISRFAKGECAVLMSGSDHIGQFAGERELKFGVSGLPYYPEVTSSPGNPFVSGSALWLIKSPKETSAATIDFLGWLAQPEQAARWYQQTGYLPLSKQAFELTPPSYYANLGQWRDLVAVYANKSAITAQGFRIRNYPEIRSRFHQILDSALSGDQPAVTALNLAASEGNRLVSKP